MLDFGTMPLILHSLFMSLGPTYSAALLLVLGTILAVVIWAYTNLESFRPIPGFPVARLDGLGPRQSYVKHGRETFAKGLRDFPGPFQVITGSGPKVVLPNHYADQIKNGDQFDVGKVVEKEFPTYRSGFEAFASNQKHPTLMADTIRLKLTPSLGLLTNSLVDEATAAIHDNLGEQPEWRSIRGKHIFLDIVARLSTRVFLGLPLCRDERWLEIAKQYAVGVFAASRELRSKPVLLRSFYHQFLQSSCNVRKQYKDSCKIMNTEITRRRDRAEKAMRSEDKASKIPDMITWLVEMQQGDTVDYAGFQLNMSMAAIHTTTEALTNVMIDLCTYPDIIPELRAEVVSVLKEDGWSRQALYKMKLMDSVLKESQRLSPISIASMSRFVTKATTLSDGTRLPKGIRILVAGKFQDPKVWPDPTVFNPKRFYNLRSTAPTFKDLHQYVSTSPEMFGFGYGQHACPGRFFANNELKIALAYLIMKYDWAFDPEDKMPRRFTPEIGMVTNPNIGFKIRRREEETKLDL